jgi:very-short-patch-repair endonuclease
MPHQKVTPFLRAAARDMRGHPVDVEKALWWRLRGRKLGGLKFRRHERRQSAVPKLLRLQAPTR